MDPVINPSSFSGTTEPATQGDQQNIQIPQQNLPIQQPTVPVDPVNPPNQLVSEELRSRIYDMLADAMIAGLQNPNPEVFTLADSEQSAEFIATRLEQLKTKDELFFFLKQLDEQWPIYHGVVSELQKEELMARVQSELQQLNGGTT